MADTELLKVIQDLMADKEIQFTDYRPKVKKKYISPTKALSLEDVANLFLNSRRPSEQPLRDMAIQFIQGNVAALERPFKEFLEEACNIPVKEIDTYGVANPTKEQIDAIRQLDGLGLAKDISPTRARELPFFCYRLDTGEPSSMPAWHYIPAKGIKNPDQMAKPLYPVYRPHGPKGISMGQLPDGSPVEVINTYIKPKWRDIPCNTKYLSPPKEIETIFRQNAAAERDYEFLIFFIYQMLTARPGVFLVLCGNPGIGKTMLKSVIKALVGFSNSVDGKKNTLTGAFNGQLLDCVYIHFDELSYTKKEEEVMKELPGATISVEIKYDNSSRSTKIHMGIVISNNKDKDNYIHFESRKFAPLLMSNIRLEDAIKRDFKVDTEKEASNIIGDLIKKLDEGNPDTYDIQYVAWIGNYILQKGAEIEKENPFNNGEYNGPRFWQLAHSSMSKWEKSVINCLVDPGYYGIVSTELVTFKEELDKGTLLYSKVQNAIVKNKRRGMKDRDFPTDYSSASKLINAFRDRNGRPVYAASEAVDPILNDFYISKLTEEQISKKIKDQAKKELEKRLKEQIKRIEKEEEEDFGGL